MSTRVDAVVAEQRQRCVRALLRHPLLHDHGPDAEGFTLVRRHSAWLAEWFSDQMGYRLVVEPTFARLRKRPVPSGQARPLETRGGAAFNRRRYTLLALALAALEAVDVQTTLRGLAELVKVHSADAEGVAPLDLDRPAERQAFVDAVRLLADWGVLRLADGDEVAFVEAREGDALYDVDVRVRAQLLACSVPPSLAESAEALTAEHYPSTDAGTSRRSRHQLMRRLLEEPACYVDDLDDAEKAYLSSQRHYLLGQVTVATGLDAEVRREGIAVLDTAGEMSDMTFPAGGTAAHAALLLGQRLVTLGGAAPAKVLRAELDALAARYGRFWAKAALRDTTARDRLFGEALGRLEALRLVHRDTDGWVRALPALARYRQEGPQ